MNDAGRMIASTWQETPRHYSGVTLDSFVVMPNHMHGIVWITSEHADGVLPSHFTMGDDCDGFLGRPRTLMWRTRGSAPTYSLSEIVQRFKSLTTRRYIDGVANYGWPRFCGRLWHRNYYDRILWNQSALLYVRRYIAENPRHTDFDGS